MAVSKKIEATFETLDQSGRMSDYFTLKEFSNSPLIRWKTSENVTFEIKSKSNTEVSRKIKNNDITMFIEGDDLYIANSASSLNTQEKGFTITVSACLACVEFANAAKAIEGINPKAFLNSVSSGTKIDEDKPHAQGSNLYIDKNGRKHFIVSYDTRKDKVGGGYLVIFSEPMCDRIKPRIMEVKCNNSRYNHPGSFQIIGDFLFLPVEDYRSDKDERASGSEVHVYDLSPLAYDGKFPEKVDWCTLETHRAGALGATDEWIAINDQENLYLYQYKLTYDENEENSRLRFYMEFVGTFEIEKTQGIGLVKDQSSEKDSTTISKFMYLIGLVTRDDTKDFICYYKIKIKKNIKDGKLNSVTFVGGDKKHKTEIPVCTEPGNGKQGKDSIHLKYGGGVYLSDDDTITCLATGRAIRTDMKFNFNIFSNVDRVELNCALENIKDSEPRASQNFSIKNFKHFTGLYCHFDVYDDKGNVVKPELIVRRDIKDGKDKDLCNITESDYKTREELGLNNTPLYLAYNSNSAKDIQNAAYLRVVVIGG